MLNSPSAFEQQALCAPSRTSFLTSRRPDYLTTWSVGPYFRKVANVTSLPQYFKDNGYFTASFGKIFHPGSVSGKTDDFPYSWSVKPFHGITEQFKDARVCPTGHELAANVICPVDLSTQPFHTLPDIESVEAASELLQWERHSTQPLFVAVGFNKPHIPLKFPRKFLEMYRNRTVSLAKFRIWPRATPLVAWNPWADLRRRDDVHKLNLTFPMGYIPEPFQDELIRAYLAATTYVDELIGELINATQHSGHLDNTVIALTSDHGWQLGEHGEWSKFSNFEAALRVPMVVSTPEIRKAPQSRAYHLPVELVDLFPTLAEVAGLPPVPSCGDAFVTCTQGRSLAPLLSGCDLPPQTAFSQYPRPSLMPSEISDQPRLRDIQIMGYTMKTPENYRYTEWHWFNHTTMRADWTSTIESELYLDDLEVANVAIDEKYADLVAKLSQELRDKFDAV